MATATLFDLKVPNLGESISEATIANWLKNEGQAVKADDVVAELETDKAAVELVAGQDGVLHLKTPKGATVAVGQVVAQIDPAGTPSAGATTTPTSTAAAATEAKQEFPPAVRRILEENKLDASKIKGTGKDGRLTKEDALAAVARNTGTGISGGGGPAQMADSAAAASLHRDQPAQFVSVPGTTSVYVEPTPENTPAPIMPPVLNKPQPTTLPGSEQRVEMSKLRQTIARRLVESQHATASLTTFNEIDMSAVLALREKYKEKFEKTYEVGLGFMSFFAKAVIQAMRAVPAVNAMIDGQTLVYRDAVHLGVAVSTEKGLMVPVVRNAHLLSMAQIELEIKRLATRAREGKITVDEMAGGTFTITNGGVFGSLLSTPILNPPQSGILGMHKIEKRAVVVPDEQGHDQIVVRPMMYVALTYDHRVIDGQQSVTFLVKVKEAIEDPTRLLLQV